MWAHTCMSAQLRACVHDGEIMKRKLCNSTDYLGFEDRHICIYVRVCVCVAYVRACAQNMPVAVINRKTAQTH